MGISATTICHSTEYEYSHSHFIYQALSFAET